MPSRKYHSKSRHGCDTCKKSKVRCDLERPICQRCRRLERSCSFAEESTLPIMFTDTVKLNPNLSKITMNKDELSADISEQEAQNLELMHHFCTSTYSTMTDDAALIPIWQRHVPQHAFRHRFLLHGLLALTALHRVTIDDASVRGSNLREKARAHQQRALSEYIPLLQDINEHNCHALFVFSAILGATSFAFLQIQEHSSSDEEFLQSFIDIFELLQGSIIIATEGREWLKQGDLAGWLGPNPFLNSVSNEVEPVAQISLQCVLKAMIHTSPTNPERDDMANRIEICKTSVQSLLTLFLPGAILARHDRLLGWPALVGASFISLLKEREPAALAILAHYGAAMLYHDRIWFLRGLGSRLIDVVSGMLEERWQPYLAWPIAQNGRM